MSTPSHDPCCPIYDLPVTDCVVCSAIAEARAEEKRTFDATWKANLPSIERRWYLEGYADGAAGHRPPERFQ